MKTELKSFQVLGQRSDVFFFKSEFRQTGTAYVASATLPGAHRAGRRARVASSGAPTAARMSSDATKAVASRTVTADVLGARFAFAIDPDRLNEAGVVWASAVRKCAEAMAPMIRNARLSASSANARDAGEDERPAPDYVNIIELGTGTGALGVALASIENTRVFVTDLEPVVGLARANAARNARLKHATSRVEAGALCWSVDPGSVPDPGSVFLDTIDAHRDETETRKQKKHNRWHFVAACETLYWGGWDVFDDDTRAPQLATMVEACAGGAVLVVAFTVRDERREKGFALNDIGGAFWLRAFDDDVFDDDDDESSSRSPRDAPRDSASDRERADARARAYVAGASEGDLLVFRGRLKERHVAT